MSKTTLKAVSWSEAGKANMAPQKRSEIAAFYKKHEGKNIEVVFRVLPRRSIQENRYYFGVVLPMLIEAMNEYGNDFDIDTMHEYCKLTFNAVDVVNADGIIIGRKAATTTDLNNEEFFDKYLESIRRFAAEELFITIPDPGTQSQLFQNETNHLQEK